MQFINVIYYLYFCLCIYLLENRYFIRIQFELVLSTFQVIYGQVYLVLNILILEVFILRKLISSILMLRVFISKIFILEILVLGIFVLLEMLVLGSLLCYSLLNNITTSIVSIS